MCSHALGCIVNACFSSFECINVCLTSDDNAGADSHKWKTKGNQKKRKSTMTKSISFLVPDLLPCMFSASAYIPCIYAYNVIIVGPVHKISSFIQCAISREEPGFMSASVIVGGIAQG